MFTALISLLTMSAWTVDMAAMHTPENQLEPRLFCMEHPLWG